MYISGFGQPNVEATSLQLLSLRHTLQVHFPKLRDGVGAPAGATAGATDVAASVTTYLDAAGHRVGDVLLAAAFQSVKDEVSVLLHLPETLGGEDYFLLDTLSSPLTHISLSYRHPSCFV